MRHGLASFAALAIVCSLALLMGGTARAATRLVGTVGPGFDISLKSGSGMHVATLRHGAYLLVVHDRSSIHNFHITGPGVNKLVTTVGFVGTKTIRITLKVAAIPMSATPMRSQCTAASASTEQRTEI